MPTYTPNYSLPKPGGSEVQDVAVLGEAMDKIDAGMKANADNIGLLIERGSNANGEYAKYSNGLLICWVRMTPSDQSISGAYAPNHFLGNRRWDFPHNFSHVPVATCSQFQVGTAISFGFVTDTSFDWVQLRAYSPVSVPAGSAVIAAMAVGRWK